MLRCTKNDQPLAVLPIAFAQCATGSPSRWLGEIAQSIEIEKQSPDSAELAQRLLN
jgi:hypothetical protein